ncbi:retrovirus-related pol polyprotein from transposon TNT 1-94 [Tanacetum coccineum]
MSQDVMTCVMNSTAVFDVNLEMQSSEFCVKCLDLDAELLNKENAYNDLSKSYSPLEKHCVSLELTMKLNQEIFQKDSFSDNQNALEIPEYFEINDLKAQLQAKDTTICKLKEHIKSMREKQIRKNKEEKVDPDYSLVSLTSWYAQKHMIGNRSQLMNFVSKFMGTVRFKNDQIYKSFLGYGDNIAVANVTISKNSLICLLSKALKTKSWLWHRRLSHLNFGTLNKLAKYGLARGIPKLKFKKDHMCSAYALGKSMRSSHLTKTEDTNQEKLYFMHMDLCDLIRVESINGKRNILMIVDDYS